MFPTISINQLLYSYDFSVFGVIAWGIAALSMGIVSWKLAEKMQIRIQRKEGRNELPGTWMTISLISIFIVTRLYFGRQLFTSPELRYDIAFSVQVLAVTGLITGYYLGRSASFLARYFRTAR